MICLGILAFFLIALGDLNDAIIKKRTLKCCFPIGLMALATATAMRLKLNSMNIIWCVIAFSFLILLLYALFGSFSAAEAYTNKYEGERTVTDTGLYAMCRHPGVLFFAGLYISLHFGAGFPILDTSVYIMLNLALAFFEDIYIFPSILAGYEEYKTKTPFLFPDKDSLSRMIKKDKNKIN